MKRRNTIVPEPADRGCRMPISSPLRLACALVVTMGCGVSLSACGSAATLDYETLWRLSEVSSVTDSVRLSRNSDYRLLDVEDNSVEARLFRASAPEDLLLIDLGEPSTALLYQPSQGLLWSMPRATIDDDGLYARVSWPLVGAVELGAVVVDSEELVLPAPQQLRLLAASPLSGTQRGSELLQRWPAYAVGMSEYRPDAAALRELGKLDEEIEVYVVFGSWCASCQRFVPRGLRVEQDLRDSALQFRYYAVPEPSAGLGDPEVLRVGVKVIPTAIVYRGGQEVGRLVGPDGFRAIERALLKLLR